MNAAKDIIIVLTMLFWFLTTPIVATFAKNIFGEYSPYVTLSWVGYAVIAGFAAISLVIALQGKPVLATWIRIFRSIAP